MPAVKPTMRRKRRYILYAIECESPTSITEQNVKRASYDAIMRFLGEYGAALALVSKFDGKRAAFRLKKVSGTIESLGVELKRKERPARKA